MINHARTFLFNLSPYKEANGNQIGEVYIPINFAPITLKDSLQKVYDILIPTGISRYQRNFILSVYMRLLHRPEFEPYTFFFDSRITYDVENQEYNKIFSSSISIDSFKSTDCNIDISYNYIEENISRNDILDYDIYNNNENSIKIKTFKSLNEFSLFKDSAKHVILIPKCLSVDIALKGDQMDGNFIFSIHLKPSSLVKVDQIIKAVDDLVSHNAHILRDLFTNVKCQETLSTLKNVWLSATADTDRLSAVLLAMMFNMTYAY